MRGIAAGATVATIGIVMILTLPMTSCEREARRFDTLSKSSPPGGGQGPFHNNAWGMSEGKRLYQYYNCVGCHANGGGGMGPPLMDDKWIYGSAPANIHQTIVEGRPNGMPSFGGKIPDTQVWMIVAYVESMSGQAPIDVMPGRSDHMRYSTPENVRRAQTPKQTGAQ